MSDPFNFGAPAGQGPGSQNPLDPARQNQSTQHQQPGQQTGAGNPLAGPDQTAPRSSNSFGSSASDPFAPTQPHAATGQNSGDPFAREAGVSTAMPSAGGGAISVARPPAFLLLIAIGLAVAAAVLAGVLALPGVAIGAWVVAGPIAIGLIALFVIRDTWARSSGVYAAPGWVKPLHWAAIVVCLLCILVPAIRIALWVGRW